MRKRNIKLVEKIHKANDETVISQLTDLLIENNLPLMYCISDSPYLNTKEEKEDFRSELCLNLVKFCRSIKDKQIDANDFSKYLLITSRNFMIGYIQAYFNNLQKLDIVYKEDLDDLASESEYEVNQEALKWLIKSCLNSRDADMLCYHTFGDTEKYILPESLDDLSREFKITKTSCGLILARSIRKLKKVYYLSDQELFIEDMFKEKEH